MINVLQDIPYVEDGMGRRQLVDAPHLLVMQVALRPGQSVPPHPANSNVHLLVLDGAVDVTLDEAVQRISRGDLLPVAFQTPMSIHNPGPGSATFLVLKAPHPSAMG